MFPHEVSCCMNSGHWPWAICFVACSYSSIRILVSTMFFKCLSSLSVLYWSIRALPLILLPVPLFPSLHSMPPKGISRVVVSLATSEWFPSINIFQERPCLVCNSQTRRAHLGIDVCRACSVFYRWVCLTFKYRSTWILDQNIFQAHWKERKWLHV